jgi:hypothetical protein
MKEHNIAFSSEIYLIVVSFCEPQNSELFLSVAVISRNENFPVKFA